MTVYTVGTFDLLHVGHLALLNHCKSLGDILVVEFNDEKRVVRLQKALDVASGQMALVEDIHGLISLVIGQGDGVATPGLAAGSAVTIRQPS